jgi:hypothetical protein
MMATESGAEALFSLPTSFPVGQCPESVADLDGDTVPDLVTANRLSDDESPVEILSSIPHPQLRRDPSLYRAE